MSVWVQFIFCTQTDAEDDHPVLLREVEAAVQSLKKGKSAGVDNIPAELVQAGGEDVITALTSAPTTLPVKGLMMMMMKIAEDMRTHSANASPQATKH